MKMKFVLYGLAILALPFVFHQKIIEFTFVNPYAEWAEKIDTEGLQVGHPLDQKHLDIAKEIGIKNPEKIRLVYVDEVPFPRENSLLKFIGETAGLIGDGIVNNAQVFGYSIYIRKGFQMDTPKLAHELVHVLQVERASFKDVLSGHLLGVLEHGYEDSPIEAEAFKANVKYREY